ncbi:MFS transporter [Duganella sp. BJB488]|uniref:MFS transporter n=1 Tax=unclassified Duganella TaxID=2636909 RepID=UPI000E35281A|nr:MULTISPECIES: MFS transporter [unclassified Duganella]NVD74869.1 MFS transporter [Duganella sp. BJB1802]RFP21980.1 MFS transporter [Duganella sp. BJB489]RFP23773.1 MFS transporter [Duganella sp. BJB488]RFP38967.1 MFS transporter [Duganella sp. BJB480]
MPRSLVALFACASGLSVANVYYAQPLLDALASDFAISPAAVGGVISATQVGSLLALLLLVPLGDRIDRRRLMLGQLLVLAAALAGVSCARSVTALVAGMLAIGLLGTAMTQGLIAYAAVAAAESERGRVVGAAQSGVVAGLLLARALAGWVADMAGWRAVYGGSALAMLAMSALLWHMLPRPPAQSLGASNARLSYLALIASMFALLRHDRVLQVRGVIALLMFVAFGILWSALVLPLAAPPHHYSHTAIGAFGLVGCAGTLAAARAGQWADRGWGQRTSLAALLLILLAWLPLWLGARGTGPLSLAALVVGILALDLGVQALQVTNQQMIFSGSKAAHSRLVGCYMMFYAAGSGAGALAATTVYARAGWSGVCLLGAAVSLAALLFWAANMLDESFKFRRRRCT